jgi:hypothetical protein
LNNFGLRKQKIPSILMYAQILNLPVHRLYTWGVTLVHRGEKKDMPFLLKNGYVDGIKHKREVVRRQ